MSFQDWLSGIALGVIFLVLPLWVLVVWLARRVSGVNLLKAKWHKVAVYTVLVFMVFVGVYLSLTSGLQPSWRNL
ncbi:hypothetical protein [Rhizobium sp. RAF56]|uniref:hypothetical protein n=1 Tax=Rhizobium sp. RAF56 TaxID=3233062 RepID=UPI003F9694FD